MAALYVRPTRILMFFRGISSSPWPRAAYLLTIVCFVIVPLHLLDLGRLPKSVLAYFSACVFLFSLLVAMLHRPRDARLAFYGFCAWLIHSIQ